MRVRNIFLIMVMVIALAAVSVAPALAWNCAKYNFQVLEDGTVQVENKSNSNEPAQSAKVYINGVLVTTLAVPAMPAHTNWTTIGSITPPSGDWTWQVTGTSDCSDSGSFEEPWDRSSIEVTGVCLDDGSAKFTITNTGDPGEGDMDGPSDWRLYVDEFQNFATGSFIKIMSEARKYRLDIMLANQYMAQIPEEVQKAILGNAGTIISFAVGANDAAILFKEFAEVFSESDLVNLSNYQIATKLTIDGYTTRPFLGLTLPLPVFSNLNRDKVIKVSRERWSKKLKSMGTPQEEVEAPPAPETNF